MNIKEGVALCRGCSRLVKLSAIAIDPAADVSSVDITETPAGCWSSDNGIERVVGATNRSAGAVLLLLCTLFWNGIVGVFVNNLVNDWLRALAGKSSGWATGGLIGETLFMLPFVLIGVLLGGFTIYLLLGKIELTLREGQGCVFWGVGSIGRRKRFELAGITDVRLEKASWQQNDQPVYLIQINTDPPVKFGSTLADARKKWFAATAHDAILGC